MKEITFLKQNHEKWQQFEALLNSQQGRDPDALADLFIRITDDLSWARTFYPGSNTEKYLNGLAARIHQEIYKNKKERRSRLVSFWTHELPLLMAKNRLNLFIAFAIFGISCWIGVISAQHDEGFVRIILGDEYVDMTLDNIAAGDPLGVYKRMENQFVMFLYIALNNSGVALMCILGGLLGWVGVAYMQFKNGVMLGAFSYFLYQHGAGYEFLLTVWIHGVIEIWCIIVAGAAGMAFGKGLWFPGAWPRGVSFMRGTREALKIGIGLIPFFFLAAFFEGFMTRYTAMHDIGRMAIIGGSLVFMVWYFIVWPFFVEQKEKGPLALGMVPFFGRLFILTRLAGKIVSAKMMFLLTLGFLMITLPAVSLFMQLTTDVEADLFTNFFLVLTFFLGVGSIVLALVTKDLVEEKDLVIDRKGSGKAAAYERDTDTVKV